MTGYVPLHVREGGRRDRFAWWVGGRRERLAVRIAPWLAGAAHGVLRERVGEDLVMRVLAYSPDPPSRGLLADIEAFLDPNSGWPA